MWFKWYFEPFEPLNELTNPRAPSEPHMFRQVCSVQVGRLAMRQHVRVVHDLAKCCLQAARVNHTIHAPRLRQGQQQRSHPDDLSRAHFVNSRRQVRAEQRSEGTIPLEVKQALHISTITDGWVRDLAATGFHGHQAQKQGPNAYGNLSIDDGAEAHSYHSEAADVF